VTRGPAHPIGLPRRLAAPALAVLALAALQLSSARAESGTSTFDYRATPGLSQPVYDVMRETFRVPMTDGIELHVEVVRPTVEGRFPVIMQLSTYNGTDDRGRIGQGPLQWPLIDGEPAGLTQYFPQRGYVVAVVDLRGTGKSQGCLDLMGPVDARDTKTIVEWAASRPWSSGRVGITGFSTPGSATVLATSQQPQGLVTAVPIAAQSRMYDHQFQGGVPFFLQWAGTMSSYQTDGTVRHLPPNEASEMTSWPMGDSFGNDPEDTGCGWTSSSLLDGEGQVSGQYTAWHAARDYRRAAIQSPIPVFLVQGVYDRSVRPVSATWFFERLASRGDKLWLGPWPHRSPRAAQFTMAMHAWFDHHLQQRDVPTGPAVEAFLADAPTLEAALTTRTDVYAAEALPETQPLALHPHSSGELGSDPEASAGSMAFTGDPRDGATGIVRPDYGEETEATGNATFVSEPVTEDTLFLGIPSLRLEASVSTPRVHLIATLYDQHAGGSRRRITTFAINPERRNGLDQIAPVVPGQRMELHPPGFPVAHNLRAGHRLVLRVTTSNYDKVPLFGVDPRVTVYTGPGGTLLRLPTVPSPLLLDDTVPIG
jgi:putative CocE/NonD family hydrolase